MNIRLPRHSFAAALTALLTCTAFAAPPVKEVAIPDLAPVAGQHQRQRLSLDTTMNMRLTPGANAGDDQKAKAAQLDVVMPLTMSMRAEQTVQTGQPDAQGWLPLSMTMRTSTFSMRTSSGAPLNVPTPPSMNMTLKANFNPKDFDFQIQEVEGQDSLNDVVRTMASGLIKQTFAQLKGMSQRKLKIGESLTLPLDMPVQMPTPGMPGNGQMQAQAVYTLNRIDKGLALFDVGVNMDFNGKFDVPAPAAAASAPDAASSAASAPATGGGVMLFASKGAGQGQMTLRLADRLVTTNKLDMTMNMTMNMPDGSVMQMDMSMKVQGVGENLKRPAKR